MKLKKLVLNSVGVLGALALSSTSYAGGGSGGIGPITGDSITVGGGGGVPSGGGSGIFGAMGVEGELSAGYESEYIFRGSPIYGQGDHATNDHLVWTGLDLNKDLGGGVSLNLGTWYASLVEDDYTELDLYAGLSYDLGPVTLGIGYTYYYFGHNGGDTDEVGASLSTTLFDVLDLGLNYYADLEANNGSTGHYLELSTGYSAELSENVALELGASIAYSKDYYTSGEDFDNILLKAALPIRLSSNASLVPFIAYSIPLDAAEARNGSSEETLYGGASISVSF